MRVLVLGGAGNFGARIVRALKDDTNLSLIAAGRRALKVPGAPEVQAAALDWRSASFSSDLLTLAPDLVIHCAGPFQCQDYRVAEAALAVGAHYLDLADGRDFVVGFAAALDEHAAKQGKVLISGASTLPALSSAVVDTLSEPLRSIDCIEVTIAPGQLAVLGDATAAAMFSYLGRPLPIWRDGQCQRAWGWMDVQHVNLDIGRRWEAACDVADLSLFPERYRGVRDVRFHAALEFKIQHAVLWLLAGLRRARLPIRVDRWATSISRFGTLFDPIAGAWGGMRVSVVGENRTGTRVRRTWHLSAPTRDGPEIPCMPSILLVRQMARSQFSAAGAYACMGMLKLEDFAPHFERWGIRTRVEESEA